MAMEILLQVVLWFAASLCGIATLFRFLYNLVKHGANYLIVKERETPPKALVTFDYGQHKYIKLKTVKLHYVENGDQSKPLLLFLHGFPEFWYAWRHQLKYFAANYWVVAVDMRGYGESEKPPNVKDYDLEVLVQDVAELVQGLGRKSCILVGHDWGGAVAWTVAHELPNVVDKLIIMNMAHPKAFGRTLLTSIPQIMKSWYVFFFQIPYLPEWLLFKDDLNIFNTLMTDEKGRLIMTRVELEAFKYTYSTRESWTAPINYYRQNISGKKYVENQKRIPKITAPTLIIWGRKDNFMTNDHPKLARRYVQNLTVKYISKGSHFIQQHKPDEVNAYMDEFLHP